MTLMDTPAQSGSVHCDQGGENGPLSAAQALASAWQESSHDICLFCPSILVMPTSNDLCYTMNSNVLLFMNSSKLFALTHFSSRLHYSHRVTNAELSF